MISFIDQAIQDLEEVQPTSFDDLINHIDEIHKHQEEDEMDDFYRRFFFMVKVFNNKIKQ